jgi:integrase/recombinase XerD
MIDFSQYLQQLGYSDTTIISYQRKIDVFLLWVKQRNYEVETITYKAVENYIGTFKTKKRNLKDRTIKLEIGILRLFFSYLMVKGYRPTNPLDELNYHAERDFEHQLLSKLELEELYFSFPTETIKYPSCPSVAIRNKVITGLAVYQGLSATDVKKLEIEHLNLSKATIYIPGTKRTNSRTLKLQGHQIFVLMMYIQTHREILLKRLNRSENYLFPCKNGHISNITCQVTKQLKKLNFKVTNLNQIRSSVITIWTEEYNLRKVQVMVGHRFISSTEKYKINNQEAMQKDLEQFHPIQ